MQEDHLQSPSPRRAWIEIKTCTQNHWSLASPSPRRAWIEIVDLQISAVIAVSPSPRRAWIEILIAVVKSFHGVRRPPRGGRGLKLKRIVTNRSNSMSPSPRRAWIEMRNAPEYPLRSRASPSPRRGANLFQKNPTKNRLGVTEITPSLFYNFCGYKLIGAEDSGS